MDIAVFKLNPARLRTRLSATIPRDKRKGKTANQKKEGQSRQQLTVDLTRFKGILKMQFSLVNTHSLSFMHTNTPSQVQWNLTSFSHDPPSNRDGEGGVENGMLCAVRELDNRSFGFPMNSDTSSY